MPLSVRVGYFTSQGVHCPKSSLNIGRALGYSVMRYYSYEERHEERWTSYV